jgi:hypothetical protein
MNDEKGLGRKLRRARNVVKRFEKEPFMRIRQTLTVEESHELFSAINQKRYERACALILAYKLRQ